VTDVPGTTRDSLTESISIAGFPITLTDTAGLRDSPDQVEQLGVKRSHQAIADADLVLMVVDGAASSGSETVPAAVSGMRQIVVRNKNDLPTFQSRPAAQFSERVVEISAHTGAGLEELRTAIIDSFGNQELTQTSLLITDARQHDLLLRAAAEVKASLTLLHEGRSEELIVIGLNNALRFVGEITGETTTEDILSEIFSTFCIGK
jgi:tRNA modification GTPase